MANKNMPGWGKNVKKVLIDKGMTMNELADQIGLSRTHLSAVICGRVESESAKEKICDYLGLDR